MTADTPAIPADVLDAAVEAAAKAMYRTQRGASFIRLHDTKRTRESDSIEMDRAYQAWDSGRAGWAMYRTYREAARAALTAALPRVIAAAKAEDSLTRMIEAQRAWSTETFGPGPRLNGVLDHIRKELTEVEAAPTDVTEWIDVVILALDGAWRSGHTSEEIVEALQAKYVINAARTWPDWRTASPDHAIEHDRTPTS